MQTIEVSDSVYKMLLSRQHEGESMSSVIQRELNWRIEDERWDVEKLDADTEKVLKSSPDFCELDEVLQ